MPDFLQFHRLGFKCNPFRVLTNEEWAALSIVPSHVLALVKNTNGHIQFIGDMGRGKSTLLLGVLNYLRQQDINTAYEYIPEGQRHFTTRQLPDVFLIDEVQRLIWWERRRLFKQIERGRRLIFSTHKDMEQMFRRRAMALEIVDVNSLYDTRLLFEMWQHRLDYFRTDDSKVMLTMDGVEFLVETFKNDRRSMERFLYEAFQALQSPQTLNHQYLSKFRMSLHSEQV